MTDGVVAETESTSNGDEELDSERRDENESPNPGTEENGARWAVRGAVIGAVVGSVAGAGVGFLVAQRPDALKQAGNSIRGSGSEVARAAATAAGEVVASRGLTQLIAANDTDDRSQLMKQTAMDAGAEAAKAARDAIVSLRREAA